MKSLIKPKPKHIIKPIEKQWVIALKNGDEHALKAIFNQYYKYLIVTANNYIGDDQKAKDIVQDIFFELWKKRTQINVQSSLKAYLRRAAINRSLNYIKSSRRFQFGDTVLDMELKDREERIDEVLEANDLQQVINHTIDQLPARCRLVFLLSRKENFSHKKIAAELNISMKTIENQITKALKLIRKSVEKYGVNPFFLLLGFLNF